MPLHVVKRGLDIPIKGGASGNPVQLDPPDVVGFAPTEIRGITPRLDAREGETVQAGSPLFHSKAWPEMKFLSPVSGRVKEIRRGRRRVIVDIVIEREGELVASFQARDLSQLRHIGREDATTGLLASGLWAKLRRRPLSRVAEPGTVPQSILIGAMETGPIQPGSAQLLTDADHDPIQAGIHVLKALTDGPVYLAMADGDPSKALAGLQNVEVHTFRGKHPTGDPAVQINLIDPPRGGSPVWYIRAWDVALIGRHFLEGRYPTERVYAAVGAGVKQPRVVRTVAGAPMAHVTGAVNDGPMRWIRGSVLTGEAVEANRFMGFYNRAVHVLPDEVKRELFGWSMPQLTSFSAHRAFLSGFFPFIHDADIRPGLWGGHRGLVPVHQFKKATITPDIYPEFLLKAIAAEDLEESIALGLLDFTEEEAALCTYLDPCKIEVDVLLQQGLQRYIQEA